jgi:hypothetical protein
MKYLASVFCGLICLIAVAPAQVTSVTINDLASDAMFQQGAVVTWKIALPAGGVSDNEIWLDVNANEVIDAGLDKLLFTFQQQDGQAGFDGPGDIDGSANGLITATFPLGLAPGSWIFKATNAGVSGFASFDVTPIPDPSYTISGTISGPIGMVENVVLEAKPAESDDGVFWHGLTDASGDYTIAIGVDPTSTNPWKVRPASEQQSFGQYVLVPRDTTFSVTGHVSGVDFNLVLGTVITGHVTALVGGAGVQGATPHLHDALNQFSEGQYQSTTDASGEYSVAVLPGKYFMHFTAFHYLDQWWNNQPGGGAYDTIHVVTTDSIYGIDASLALGAVISGRATNWNVGTNASVEVYSQQNSEFPFSSTNTKFDGSYAFTVPPGTYYVSFYKDDHTIYYDNTGYPGTPIVISGTEEVENVNGNFEIGPPPPPPAPNILSVTDVPNDQGKQVVVTWRGNEPLLVEGEGFVLGVEKFSVWFHWNNVWTFVAEVPARRDSLYSVIAPTFIDSTPAAGMHYSKYQVSSHYTYNYYVVNSQVDSGYSLDNLVPSAPGGVGGQVSGSDFIVRWRSVPDEDLRYYAVYRSTAPNFDIAGMTPYGETSDTSFTDAGAIGGTTYYYRITALDFSGNQSAASDPVSTSITGIDNLETLPTEYALHQNFPNPFNPTTQISYDVPTESFVSIILYNTLGQQVRTIVESRQTPGRHVVTFSSTGLASGLYIYKMTAGEHVSIRKMNLVK